MALNLNQIPLQAPAGSGSNAYATIYNNNILLINAWSQTILSNIEIINPLNDEDLLIYNSASSKFNNVALVSTDIESKTNTAIHYAKQVNIASTDTTLDKHISNYLSKLFYDHSIITNGNPHGITATTVGKDTAQWNANKILSKEVIDTEIADGLALIYNTSLGKIKYGLTNSNKIQGVAIVNTAIATNFGLIYDGTNLVYSNMNKATAQWNANKISDITIDNTGITDKYVLYYDLATNTVKYGEQNASKIKDIPVNTSGLADGKVLIYRSGSFVLEANGSPSTIECGNATASAVGLQIRRDTYTNFNNLNPILKSGEFSYDTTNKSIKIGDGASYWNSIAYFKAGETNTISSIGTGISVYKEKVSENLVLKSIKAGTNVLVTDTGTELVISSGLNLGVSEFSESAFFITNAVDITKKIQFITTIATTGVTRVITTPDRNITLDNINTSTTSSITGLLKANGTSVLAAIANTDYVALSGSCTLTEKIFTTPTVNTSITPVTNGSATLGTTALSWSNLYLNTAGTINYGNGNVVWTHSSGVLTLTAGILKLTNAGNVTTSVLTTDAIQTLSNKSLISSSFYIIDSTDTTKKAQFIASEILSGATRTITIPNRNITLDTITTNTTTALSGFLKGDSGVVGVATTCDLPVTVQALTNNSIISPNFELGTMATLTINQNTILQNPTNLVPGMSMQIKITQDVVGNRLLTYDTNYKWADGTAEALSVSANAVDILTLISYDGTIVYCTLVKDLR